MWQHALNNRFVLGIGVPLVLLLTGALTKKLVRATPFKKSDFFLGIEFTLGALTSALTYCCEITKESFTGNNSDQLAKIAAIGAFLVFNLILLLIVLGIHQEWEKPGVNSRSQFIHLGLFSNFLGTILILAFILLIKGF